jgi:hypothetical protein
MVELWADLVAVGVALGFIGMVAAVRSRWVR